MRMTCTVAQHYWAWIVFLMQFASSDWLSALQYEPSIAAMQCRPRLLVACITPAFVNRRSLPTGLTRPITENAAAFASAGNTGPTLSDKPASTRREFQHYVPRKQPSSAMSAKKDHGVASLCRRL
jgi:hypothetical protein